LIIEHEANFEKNSDMEYKETQKKYYEHLYKKDNEARHAKQSNPLDKPSTEGKSPLEISVHA